MSDTIMKLRYIITSLVAVCLLAIGCTKTYPSHLENIQLSQSTIGLDAEAQRAVTVDVTANGAWKIQTEIPSWLSVSPTEGPAGKTTVTFAATASSASCNKATLTIDCGGQKQYVYVQQGKGSPVNTAETAFTPDEAIEFYQDGKNKGAEIYVKGVVTTSKIDLSYGNAEFYLEATKGTFEFYRCFDFDGEKFTDSKKVQPGDIITAVGAITNYNSTIELGEGCKLVSIEKSLISVCNDKVLTDIPCEGAVVDLQVIVKGEDLKVKATDDAGAEIDWVSVRTIDTKKAEKKADPDTTVISVAIAPNVEDVRTATFAVSSETSTINVPVSQKSGLTAYPLPYSELFDKSQGAWTIENVVLPEGVDYVWSWGGASYGMKATGYVNKVNYETESDLVSPRIDLTGKTSANLKFDHVQRYGVNVFEELTLWISNDSGETWKEILIPEYTAGKNWNFITTSVSLTPYCGAQVQLKFKYKSHTTGGATWEIKNIHVTEGEVEIGNIAQLNSIAASKDKEQEWSGSFKDAQVTYVNGSNVFIEDESAGTQLYLKNSGLAAGKVINGEVSGKIKLYNGYAELTALDFSKATVTEAPVEFSEMELADLLKSYLRFQNCMVKLPGVTIASTMSSSSRTVEVSKDDAKINAYLQDKNVTVEAGTGDLTCFPTRYNANLQLGVWTPDHFVK